MQDLISRQAAIDAVESMLRRKFGIGGDLAEITLAELPSAQPDLEEAYICGETEAEARFHAQQRWIPCSERLPEPRVAVLGYAPKFKNIFALYYDSVMGWMVWSPIRDDCLPNSQGDIIAWMPLPEPYQAERREK